MTRRQLLLSSVLTAGVIAAAAMLFFASNGGGLPASEAAASGPITPETRLRLTADHGPDERWLRIRAIDVDAPLREMEPVDPAGLVPAPDGPDVVGWYRSMTSDKGATHGLLLGHVNWRDGSSGVFARLGDVAVGDLVELRDGRTTVAYRVASIDHLDALSTALPDVLGSGPPDTVTLITCSGEYLWDIGTYSERTVVLATRIDGAPPEDES